ncbi:flavodoxin domain-containing protein [Uliginosibacterium sp. sgz301328]|uniref:flavodoxin domain-containing protein n=1 Tax=Uliginosibacterium sp. sgz301328 TaxID=3243764 RepID=UPI00359D412B
MSVQPALTLWVATFDGRSAEIAQRMATRLQALGIRTQTEELGSVPPPLPDGPVLVVAAVRYGRLLPAARAALQRLAMTPQHPAALAVVCLSARRPDRRSARDNPYLRRAMAQSGLRPLLAEAFGGRLDYMRCRWFDRQMIRLIMKLTGGPSDGVSVLDYTDWGQVERFSDRLADVLGSAPH